MSILEAFPAKEFPNLATKLTLHSAQHGEADATRMTMALLMFNEFKTYIKITAATREAEVVPMLVKLLAWTMTELKINKAAFEVLEDALEADLALPEEKAA